MENSESKKLIQLKIFLNLFTRKLDQFILKKKERWIFFGLLILILFIRVIQTNGYFAMLYILGFYYLNNVILFVTPSGLPTIQEEEENEDLYDIPDTIILDKNEDASKPVIRKMGEFHLWKKMIFSTIICIICTFFEFLDLPVFWPILLIYFFVVILSVYIKQRKHMEKYGYSYSDFFKKREKISK
jgi:hypothetical protein